MRDDRLEHAASHGREFDGYLAPQGPDFLELAFRWHWLLILFALVGAGLGYLKYARTAPTYESRAQMLIRFRGAALSADTMSQQQYANAIQSATADHAIIMQSPGFIREVFTNDKMLAALPSLQGDPVGTIQRGLKVSALAASSNVLNLTFQSPNPVDCEKVLAGIMRHYEDLLSATEQTVAEEIAADFTRAEKVLRKELQDNESKLQKLRMKSGLLTVNNEGVNLETQRLLQIEAVRSDLDMQISKLRAQITSIEAAKNRGVNDDVLEMLAMGLGHGFKSGEAESNSRVGLDLREMVVQYSMLASRYGPEYPDLKQLKRRIELYREFDAKTQDDPQLKSTPKPDVIVTFLHSLEERLQVALEEKRGLDDDYNAVKVKVKALSVDEAQEFSLMSEIERTKMAFTATVEGLRQINMLSLNTSDKYFVKPLAPPLLGKQVAPNLMRMVSMGGVLASLAGFGLVYSLEKFDQRFRSPEDVSQQLQLPIVGQISQLEGRHQTVHEDYPQISPSLVAAHSPKSRFTESFRAIRTSIYFNGSGKAHRVIQITSPTPGDGKSTLSANLAITMAHSGKNVLLIDADMRRPMQHKLFGLESEIGLSSLFDGNYDPPQVIQDSKVPNLSILPAGIRPPNPSELLTSPRFEELLGCLKEQFDFIVVDTPPLLAVTDASAVAARVDSVLLVTRLQKNARNAASAACEVLRDVNADIIGVAVNGVEKGVGYGYGRYGAGSRFGGYGGYGGYRYGGYRYGGYGSRYGGYGYGQHDDETQEQVAKYYDKEEAPHNGNGSHYGPTRNGKKTSFWSKILGN